jgi:hypothetical protein
MGGSSTISNSEEKIAGIKLQTSCYGVAIPIVYGTNRISGNLMWYGNFQAIPHTATTSSGGKGGAVTSESTTYTYTAAVMMGLAEGPIAGIGAIWKGKDKTDAATLGLTLFTGLQGQSPWGWLTAYNNLSTTPYWEGYFGYMNQAAPYAQYALGYSGTAYVAASAYDLDTSAAVPNHGFEVQGLNIYGSGIVDANPRDVINDFLTNNEYGAGFAPALMADLTVYSNYCRALGIFISPAIDQQKKAADWLNDFMNATNTALVWSEGKLKAIPYGDAAATGNGATYTPNTTPVYDLDDDDFIDNKGSDPVKVERSTPADAYNRVQIEYLDRVNQYNVEIVEAKDQFSIETYGLRSMQPIALHFICDGQVAKQVAQIILQRALYVRNTYRFQLDWRYGVLEPMDLVTLTDASLGLGKLPVRITEIAEDSDGLLSVKAEDFPLGTASATLYPHDSGQRYQFNLNTVPQNVVTPRFFEAPSSLTTTGLQVWAATGGQTSDPIYGGCRVWVSLDGTTYKAMGVINGSARFGLTTATYAAHAAGFDNSDILSVALSANGQLLSGSNADAVSGITLTAVGQEYLAYTTATLTGTNAYNLTLVNRGLYSTNPASHASGSAWARIDAAIAKSDDLDMSMVGKTLYFKFTAFNVYGGGEQSLAAVSAYTYTVTGYMTQLPPSNVASLSASTDAALTITLSWPAVSDLDIGGYEIRDGTTWASATVLGPVKGTTYKLGLVSGSHTYQVKALDVNGNYSATAATTSVSISTSSAVTSLTVSAVTVSGSAGTQSPAFNISWTAANSAILQSTAIEYKKSSDSAWIAYSNVTPPTLTAQIVGIEPSTNYDVRVAELYNNGVKSPYATVSAITSTSLQTVGSASAVPWTGVTGGGKPADNATVGATWGVNIGGSNLPANNATVNNVTYAASAPASPVNGDIWVDTSVPPNVTKVRVAGVWQVGANYSTNTNQLTDGAGLGTTAIWTGITGAAKPADNATYNIGALADLNAVDTAQITNNAVTNSWAYYLSSAVIAPVTAYTLVATITITTTGGRVYLSFSSGAKSTTASADSIAYSIYRGNNSTGTLLFGSLVSAPAIFEHAYAANFSESPAAGTYTYNVYATGTTISVSSSHNSLYAQELKK